MNSLNPGPLTVRLETAATKMCRSKLGKLVGKGSIRVCRLVPCNANANVFTIY